MPYSDLVLSAVYDRTAGRCHICHKKLAYTNHGKSGERGAWHVEHSHPRARGGTSHLNNLYPACIKCNLEKGTIISRTARGWNARKRAPLSRERLRQSREANTLGGGLTGVCLGAMVGGPPGALLFGLAGLFIGSNVDPEA